MFILYTTDINKVMFKLMLTYRGNKDFYNFEESNNNMFVKSMLIMWVIFANIDNISSQWSYETHIHLYNLSRKKV